MPGGVSISPVIWKYGCLSSVIKWRTSCMSTNCKLAWRWLYEQPKHVATCKI